MASECPLSDVNECDSNNGGCSDHCSNNPGSYSCHCRKYADLDPDGRRCTCRPGFIQNDVTVTCDGAQGWCSTWLYCNVLVLVDSATLVLQGSNEFTYNYTDFTNRPFDEAPYLHLSVLQILMSVLLTMEAVSITAPTPLAAIYVSVIQDTSCMWISECACVSIIDDHDLRTGVQTHLNC